MKKSISLFLALVMVLATFTFLPVSATSGTMAGEGTLAEPYLVADKADVLSIGRGTYAANAYYKLTADIDMNGHNATWNGLFGLSNNDTTYGQGNGAFAGTLDGDGHCIFNFRLESQGIFNTLDNGATIKNITFGRYDDVSTEDTDEYNAIKVGKESFSTTVEYQFGVLANQVPAGTVNVENVNIIVDADLNVGDKRNDKGALGASVMFRETKDGAVLNVKDCNVEGTYDMEFVNPFKADNYNGHQFGGLVGLVGTGATIDVDGFTYDVDYKATITYSTKKEGFNYLKRPVFAYGGLIGRVVSKTDAPAADNKKINITVDDFTNTGKIEVVINNTATATAQLPADTYTAVIGGCIGFVQEGATKKESPVISISNSTFASDAVLSYSDGFYDEVPAGNMSFDNKFVSSKGYMIGSVAYVDAGTITLTDCTNVSADTALEATPHYEYQPNIRFIGAQKNTTANSVRFLAVVDSLDYESINFEVKTNHNEIPYIWNQEVTSAYLSIKDGATTVTATELGGLAIVAFVLTDIPAESIDFQVKLTQTGATAPVWIETDNYGGYETITVDNAPAQS